MSDLESIVRWWIALTVLAAALAPIVWWLGAPLGEAANAFLRPLALVAGSFVAWWPAALFGLPFSPVWIVVLAGGTGVVAWALWIRARSWRSVSGGSLVVYELVWSASFLGYLWFRSFNPDIANTEKPMEIALLTSISRSSEVPAPDPWFAGEAINYYYFGYQMLGTLVKVTEVPASIGFNLGLATIFASLAAGAAGLGAFLVRLVSRRKLAAVGGATLAVFFVLLAGNLESAVRLVQDPSGTISAGWWDGVGWQASRVIYDHGVHGSQEATQTINEFPAFSFVLGDLHPHVVAYPLLLSVVALAVGLVARPEIITWPRVGVAGGLAGILYATNSWDAPLAWGLVVGAILLGRRALDREALILVIAGSAGAMVAALPFALHYTAPVGVETGDVPGWLSSIPVLGTLLESIAVVTWRPSSTSELLTVYGPWIALFWLYAIWVVRTYPVLLRRLQHRQAELLIGLLILIAIAVAWAPAALLLGVPIAISLTLVILDDRRIVRLLGGLFAVGFGLALIPEFIYLQDPFGNRMNTVFKLGFQAWLVLAIASAGSLVAVVALSTSRFRYGSVLIGVLTVALTVPYTPLSATDWADLGVAEGTIDGAAYLSIANPAEAAAIAWVAHQADDGDVLVEAPGCGYQVFAGVPMNRVSAFTGVPTVMGWANHEAQWRRGQFENPGHVLEGRQEQAHSWLDGELPPHDGYATPRFVVFGAHEVSQSDRCDLLRDRGPEELARLEQRGWVTVFAEDETRVLVRETDSLAGAHH